MAQIVQTFADIVPAAKFATALRVNVHMVVCQDSFRTCAPKVIFFSTFNIWVDTFAQTVYL